MSLSVQPVTEAQTGGESRLPSRKRKSPDGIAPPQRNAGSYQRAKSANACLVCRARKTKCDNVWPTCGFCTKTGGECSYTQPSPLRFDQASLTILKQLGRIEELLTTKSHDCCVRQLLDQLDPVEAQRLVARSHSSGEGLSQSIPEVDSCRPSLDEYNNVPQQLSPNTLSGGYDSDRYAIKLQSLLDVPPSPEVLSRATEDMGIESMLSWPVFQTHFRQLGISLNGPVVELLGRVPRHAEPSSDNGHSLDVDRQTVLRLVENFLVNNNLKNPIIDPVELRYDAEQFVNLTCSSEGKICRMFLVLAIGSISLPLAGGAPPGQIGVSRESPEFRAADSYFQAALRHVGPLYCENSLVSVQCAFLTGVYFMYTMRIMAAWKAFVQASTQCLGYFASRRLLAFTPGLHGRDKGNVNGDQQETPSSSNTRALEDSLYWSCLKSEVELRLELGFPGSGINDIQYPHIFPSVPGLALSTTAGHGTQASSLESDSASLVTGWLFYLGEIALKRLLYRVLSYSYSDSDDNRQTRREMEGPDYDLALWHSVKEFDLQLDQWMRALPPPMRFSPTSVEPLNDVLPWVLRGHRVDIIEALRFPAFFAVLNADAAGSATTNARSSFAQQLPNPFSETTIKLAKEYLDNAVHRIETNAEGFLYRHQGSWLTIRSCTRSALALLAVKLHYQRGDGSQQNASYGSSNPYATPYRNTQFANHIIPDRWRHCVILVLAMLKAWEAESPDVRRLRLIVEGLLSCCHD